MRITANDLPRCDHDDCTAESENGSLFCTAHRDDPTYDVLFRRADGSGSWLTDARGLSARGARVCAEDLIRAGYSVTVCASGGASRGMSAPEVSL